MFSGISNQVTSWMGTVKGEPQDEEVPTPAFQESNNEQAQNAETSQQLLEDVPIASEGDEGAKVQRYENFAFFMNFH